jgi:2-amino-4-hydroxy-6-hydroxymethyldihydropteridine diphosphokinase
MSKSREQGTGNREQQDRTEKEANWAYFSLGSNINPEQNLPAAVRELAEHGRIAAVSQVWESAPFVSGGAAAGPIREANFLNAAVLLETALSARMLCADVVPAIESRLGRVRDPHDKNAPRTIDVDLVLFNRDVLEVGRRTIPDPELLSRAFVAAPIAELDPDYLHPLNGRRLADIAAQLTAMQSLRLRADVNLGRPGACGPITQRS